MKKIGQAPVPKNATVQSLNRLRILQSQLICVPLWWYNFQINTWSLSFKACAGCDRRMSETLVSRILSTLPIPVQKSTGMQNPCVHPAFQQWKAFVVSVLLRFPLLLSGPCWKQMKSNILINVCTFLVYARVWLETQRWQANVREDKSSV